MKLTKSVATGVSFLSKHIATISDMATINDMATHYWYGNVINDMSQLKIWQHELTMKLNLYNMLTVLLFNFCYIHWQKQGQVRTKFRRT